MLRVGRQSMQPNGIGQGRMQQRVNSTCRGRAPMRPASTYKDSLSDVERNNEVRYQDISDEAQMPDACKPHGVSKSCIGDNYRALEQCLVK